MLALNGLLPNSGSDADTKLTSMGIAQPAETWFLLQYKNYAYEDAARQQSDYKLEERRNWEKMLVDHHTEKDKYEVGEIDERAGRTQQLEVTSEMQTRLEQQCKGNAYAKGKHQARIGAVESQASHFCPTVLPEHF